MERARPPGRPRDRHIDVRIMFQSTETYLRGARDTSHKCKKLIQLSRDDWKYRNFCIFISIATKMFNFNTQIINWFYNIYSDLLVKPSGWPTDGVGPDA